MRLTRLAVARPVTTVMFFVALGLIGVISGRLLPLEKFPDIQFPGIFVQVPYQGSTPEEVERLITRPIEEVLATLPGVERMRSTSTQNQAQIFLQFGWTRTSRRRASRPVRRSTGFATSSRTTWSGC